MSKDYKISFIILSDNQHPSIRFDVRIDERTAKTVMMTPVKNVSIRVSSFDSTFDSNISPPINFK